MICHYSWVVVFFLIFFFLSHKLLRFYRFSNLLPSEKESSSGAPGVRALLRQHKPANSLLPTAPIPPLSLLIPGLIIPRLWQSSARQTSAQSAVNGPTASPLRLRRQPIAYITVGWGGTSCTLYFTGTSRSPPWERVRKRIYFCIMSAMHSFAHLLSLWGKQPLLSQYPSVSLCLSCEMQPTAATSTGT